MTLPGWSRFALEQRIGQLTFSNAGLMLQAAADGLCLACVLENIASGPLVNERPVPVLEAGCGTRPDHPLNHTGRAQAGYTDEDIRQVVSWGYASEKTGNA